MGNVGTFTLNLQNAEGDPAIEPRCTVDFLDLQGANRAHLPLLQFPPQHSFTLPAFPQAQNWHCAISPSLYGVVQSHFFTLTDGEQMNVSATVLRGPGQWMPKFTAWGALSANFDDLKASLANQFLTLKHGPDIGVLTPAVYNSMSSPAQLLAKMALLNLFSVTAVQVDPVSNQPWFKMVQRMVRLDRERFVAVVSSDMFESVDHISRNLPTFAKLGFFPGDSSLHLDNIPGEYQITAPMISVKCRYEQGNVQFTMSKARKDGQDLILLDCDMDEHSNAIEHASDVFIHVFNGGTHPIDIHEYIVHHQRGVDLGYTLRPNDA